MRNMKGWRSGGKLKEQKRKSRRKTKKEKLISLQRALNEKS